LDNAYYESWENTKAYESNDDGSDHVQEGEDDLPHPDDDRATVSTRTEDDPVRLAMDAVLSESEEDDDEEEILYPQSYRPRPV
jgi:hypothetical protein